MVIDAQQQQLPVSDFIWLRILQEVSAKNSTAVQGSVVLLGNERCGKSSLVNRLTRGERPGLNSVLEYNYLQIQADTDASYAYQLGGGAASGLLGPTDSADLPLWLLDGKDECASLLRFVFPPTLAKCAVCVCASMEQPGNIMPALSQWYRLLDEQIRQHYQPEEIVQARQAQVRFWQEYMEPIESMHHSTATLAESNATLVGGVNGGTVNDPESSPLLLPPEKGILEENCGAILIVVITKSDLHMELSAEQLDRLQYHVRKFCLQHGAALIYTSAKDDLNTQQLHKYIAHRIFSLPFTAPAYIVERDRIFVPTGWDSDQKLAIIKETLVGSDLLDVPMLAQQCGDASPFSSYRSAGEKEVEAEDEQSFLARLNTMALDGGGGLFSAGGGQQSPRRAGGDVGGKAPGDNTMLANFFSSLLKDKDHHQRSPASSVKSGHSGGGGTFNVLSGGGGHSAASSQIAIPAESEERTARTSSPRGGTSTVHVKAEMEDELEGGANNVNNNNNDEGEEEDFEDAPDESDDFSSSMSSQQNVTPRTAGDSQQQKQQSSLED
uniref:Dynein light intermediate chain n=1 Tax=Globodera rostochiensis TaxID=31243 RepID=A0A914I082_GLORO